MVLWHMMHERCDGRRFNASKGERAKSVTFINTTSDVTCNNLAEGIGDLEDADRAYKIRISSLNYPLDEVINPK